MSGRYDCPVGVIEGFFGKPWSWQERAATAAFLAALGFDHFIYAPKDDRFLRQRWREPWPDATAEQTAALGATCRDNGLRFGIGFSPFELHLDQGADVMTALRGKVRQLNQVGPDILCILFDDMRGNSPDLAARQARVVAEITRVSNASAFIACPSYYSFDPVIERVFGAMPPNYLADLGRLIDPAVGLFWTGPKVCSRSYPEDHLAEVAALLRRKPFLWDNYPVNDSAAMAPFLHIGPFRDRPASLPARLAGHAINPMNQAWLSRIPLRTLADSYAQGKAYDPERSFAEACRTLCGQSLGQMLIGDFALLQRVGLGGLTTLQRRYLAVHYGDFRDDPHAGPYAAEVLRWLDGHYAFDPACLT